MINLNNIQNIYMLGIGGIGMSALARYFVHQGKTVSGYDLNQTALTHVLEGEGIAIHYDDNPGKIPANVQLVVYTPAIPESLGEFRFLQHTGIPMLKRAEVLGLITEEMFTIGVAGTHGKTIISAMIAHILTVSGYGCNAFLGGIAANYNTNFRVHKNNCAVVEADDYDRSFLSIHPDVAIVSSIHPDHLEVYGSLEEMKIGFRDFLSGLKPDGKIFLYHSLKEAFAVMGYTTYSADNMEADIHALNIISANGGYYFDVKAGEKLLKGFQLNIPGRFNLNNITVAIAVADALGIKEDAIRQAIGSFRGVRRRFEYVFRSPVSEKTLIYIDDYAHHPEALKALIEEVKEAFPDYRMLGIFQPQLYSRTGHFAKTFAGELDKLDEVILLPVFAAREMPIEEVDSYLIKEHMQSAHVLVMEMDEVPEYIHKRLPGTEALHSSFLVLTIGAGNIETLRAPLKAYFETISENTLEPA